MIEPAVISNAPPPLRSMRFDLLLDKGMRACQQLAGKRWTDYNEHDPGVTIIEQLAYGLTDAAYRLNYPVADLLATPDGQNPPAAHGSLVTGNLILSGQPLTILDYRKLLYDKVDHLHNVWLKPACSTRGKAIPGLYTVLVERSEHAGKEPADTAVLIGEVRRYFHAQRNLGEDIDTVMVLKPVELSLRGTITVSEKADPDQVMAQVLFAVQDMLTPRPRFSAVDDLFRDGVTPDRVFDGPLLDHGVLADDQLCPFRDSVNLRQIRAAILGVDGVRMVADLAMALPEAKVDFIDDETSSFRLDHGQLFHLLRPDELASGSPGLTLRWRDIDYTVNRRHVQQLLAQMQDDIGVRERYAQYRHSVMAYGRLPSGQYRAVETYYSIQHQFPATYGLGRYGVPQQTWQTGSLDQPIKGGRRQRHVQVGQLRAYLLFFEQILANHFSQLSHLGELFSTDAASRCSYYFQPLAHRQALPGDAIDVLPLLRRAAPPAPTPAAGGTRLVAQVTPRQARRHPALLRSPVVASATEAARLAVAILGAGVRADAYALTAVPGRVDRFILTLRGSDGQALAFATHPFRTRWAAERARGRLAAWLRMLAADAHLRRRHIGVQALGETTLSLDDEAGPLLRLSGLTAADANALTAQLLDDGQRPAQYHVPHGGRARVGIRLGSGPGARFAELQRPAANHRQALAQRDAMIAWLGRLACDPKLRARYLSPSPPVLPEDGLTSYEAGLQALVQRFDPGVERRHQFVDHLLARLDERFDDDALASFDPRGGEKAAFRAELLAWKCRFLQEYAAPGLDLGGRRSAGVDCRDSAASASGLEQRLRLLLGIGNLKPRAADGQRPQMARLLRGHLADGVRFTEDQRAISVLLAHGGVKENYPLKGTDGNYRIMLHHGGKRLADPMPLAAADSKDDADRVVEALIDEVHQMQSQPEQIYAGEELVLVEHVLLRPRERGARRRSARDPFLHLRVSLLLPIHTMRFGRPEFRRFVEATAAANCPAHLQLDVLWVGPGDMARFVRCYRHWRRRLAAWEKRQDKARGERLDQVSAALQAMLQELGTPERVRQ